MNDRLLLGLKGTMSEYELSLLRQRGLAARDAKADRGALRFTLPPGLVWSEDRIELDPDERVQEVIRLVFAKFQELGSAREVFLWIRDAALKSCPWSGATASFVGSSGGQPPTTAWCRFCKTRSTPAPNDASVMWGGISAAGQKAGRRKTIAYLIQSSRAVTAH
jgi:hypothetical protein